MKTYLIIFLLFFLTCSCATLDIPKTYKNLQVIGEDNIKMMNGNYNVISKDNSYRTLEFVLFKTKEKYPLASLRDSTYMLNLDFINNKRLKVTLLQGNEILKTKIRKGKIQGGYFVLNKSFYGTFWLIINSFGEQTSRIGLLKNNNITVDTFNGGAVFIVIIPFGGSDSELYNLEFERKK